MVAHFPVRLACVRRAASVDSEPGSNSHLKCRVFTSRSGLLRVLTSSSLLHPTRLSMICATLPGVRLIPGRIAGLETRSGVPRRSTDNDYRKNLAEIFKRAKQEGRYRSTRWPAQSFVTIPCRGSELFIPLNAPEEQVTTPSDAQNLKASIGDLPRIPNQGTVRKCYPTEIFRDGLYIGANGHKINGLP
jgi:hypothetical protein